MKLRFGELRKYISTTDRLSVCRKETLQYDNFRYISQVPDLYNDFYVHGIGLIESEFKIEDESIMLEANGKKLRNGYFLAHCIEVVVSEKPQKFDRLKSIEISKAG